MLKKRQKFKKKLQKRWKKNIKKAQKQIFKKKFGPEKLKKLHDRRGDNTRVNNKCIVSSRAGIWPQKNLCPVATVALISSCSPPPLSCQYVF